MKWSILLVIFMMLVSCSGRLKQKFFQTSSFGPFGGTKGNPIVQPKPDNYGKISKIIIFSRSGHFQQPPPSPSIRLNVTYVDETISYGDLTANFTILNSTTLASDEHIQRGTGSYWQVVSMITFYTNKKKYGPFGKRYNSGTDFDVSGGRLLYISGRSNKVLDSITFHFYDKTVTSQFSKRQDYLPNVTGPVPMYNQLARSALMCAGVAVTSSGQSYTYNKYDKRCKVYNDNTGQNLLGDSKRQG